MVPGLVFILRGLCGLVKEHMDVACQWDKPVAAFASGVYYEYLRHPLKQLLLVNSVGIVAQVICQVYLVVRCWDREPADITNCCLVHGGLFLSKPHSCHRTFLLAQRQRKQ